MKFIDTDAVHIGLAHMWSPDNINKRIAAARKAGDADWLMYINYEERWQEWKRWLLNGPF